MKADCAAGKHRQASKAFGKPEVFIEKCVVNPKHISMSDTVAVMTGAKLAEELPEEAHA